MNPLKKLFLLLLLAFTFTNGGQAKFKPEKIFTKNIPEFPKEVALKLPQLKKIELPKLTKING